MSEFGSTLRRGAWLDVKKRSVVRLSTLGSSTESLPCFGQWSETGNPSYSADLSLVVARCFGQITLLEGVSQGHGRGLNRRKSTTRCQKIVISVIIILCAQVEISK